MGGLFLICWAYTMKDSDLLRQRAAVGSARVSYQGESARAGRRLGFVFEYKK
jgi:hypothetical protein